MIGSLVTRLTPYRKAGRSVFSAVARIFRTPDLRRKIAFTLGIIALFRLGLVHPGARSSTSATCRPVSPPTRTPSGLLRRSSTSSAAARCCKLSIFALGIMPYITASIIVQLLRVVIPHFETLYKEGQAGQAQADAVHALPHDRARRPAVDDARSRSPAAARCSAPTSVSRVHAAASRTTSWYAHLLMVITMTAGTGLIMWIGELVTERGIGNGMSLLIFTSIAAQLPGVAHRRSRSRKGFEILLVVIAIGIADRRGASCSSSSRSGASRCSTPSAWSAGARTAATTRTSRSRSTWPASCPSSSPRRCCTCPR